MSTLGGTYAEGTPKKITYKRGDMQAWCLAYVSLTLGRLAHIIDAVGVGLNPLLIPLWKVACHHESGLHRSL